MHVSLASSKGLVLLFTATATALARQLDPSTSSACTQYLTAHDSTWDCARFESAGTISHEDFVSWNPSVKDDCSGIKVGSAYCVKVNNDTPAAGIESTPTINEKTRTVRRPGKPSNGIPTPLPTQSGMVDHCVKFYYITPSNSCNEVVVHNGISLEDFIKWNPRIDAQCNGVRHGAYACVGIASFGFETRFRANCTGEVHKKVSMRESEEYCMNTDCQVGALDIAADGPCPDGELQLSYWENPGCSGKWYGYGYANKGTCRSLWTGGWKFKAIHLRCAKQENDCYSRGTCTYDDEPAARVC